MNEDARAEWKQALAAHHRKQRQQRGRRQQADAAGFRPGMARVRPGQPGQAASPAAAEDLAPRPGA